MHIMLMLGLLTVIFFASLFLMCIYRDKLSSPTINVYLIAICAVFFFAWNYAAYEHGWLVKGFMTLENISPFICTVILFSPFLHKSVREYAYSAIAFLSLGMYLALIVSPGAEYLMNYRIEAMFIHVSEGVCHLIMAIYGFYLILSGKVKLNLRNYLKSIVFMYAAIGFGVFLNYFFRRSNFGMNMYGKYAIYFLDIFGSFTATFVAYLVGVLATLTIGFLAGIFVDWISSRNSEQ